MAENQGALPELVDDDTENLSDAELIARAKADLGVTVDEGGKSRANFFSQVREKGLLNASLDLLSDQFKQRYPSMEVKWVHYNPLNTTNGDLLSTGHEAFGYRMVQWEELKGVGESVPRTGPVRRGDQVLMCVDRATYNEQRLQDARLAYDDLTAPEQAFKTQVEANKVKTSSGEKVGATGFGKIRSKEETIGVPADDDNS